MGAWGYGAYENDTAGDWMFRHLVPLIKKTIAKKADPDEVLAAIAVVLDLDLVPWFSKEEVKAAFAFVADKNDDKYQWKDNTARRRYLKNLHRRFNRAPGTSWSPVGLISKNIRPKGVRKPEPAGKLPRKAKKTSKT